MNMLKLLISFLVFSLTLSIILSVDSSDALEPWPITELIGNKAPDFTLSDISGNAVHLSSFQGKAVLLNFWATWCPYCRQERSHLNSLYTEYKERELVILSVAIDRSVPAVKKYLKKVPSEFAILTDPESNVALKYNVVGLPTSFLIDRGGTVRHRFAGLRKWTGSESKRLIESLIKS